MSQKRNEKARKNVVQRSRHVKRFHSIVCYYFIFFDQDQKGKWEKDRKRLECMEENRYED